MHSGWSTTVAPCFSSPSELPRSPSEGLHYRCRTAPPCTESIEVFIIYLQSIGGPLVHQRA
ncbi:hypothetical protein U9M48_031112 [Paspalum notatum var. saurae]|uniref:Uncharacterized protein n=1 Tax=Paspalum notatum var. saurae TaxID=547442 RepID=A0AAQ3U314_PASNO